jgi:hypothetical protein
MDLRLEGRRARAWGRIVSTSGLSARQSGGAAQHPRPKPGATPACAIVQA